MTADSDRSTEVDFLRQRLAEYERAFESAAPRLAAFKRLEEVAHQAKTSPEAIAASAAVDVFKQDAARLETEVSDLTTERDRLRAELSMELIKGQTQQREAMDLLDTLHGEQEALVAELGIVADEMEALRSEATLLMQEKSTLELELQALRVEHGARSAPEPAPARRKTDVTDEASDDLPDDDAEPPAGAAVFDDGEPGDAFDRFFSSEIEHDKARDWILK